MYYQVYSSSFTYYYSNATVLIREFRPSALFPSKLQNSLRTELQINVSDHKRKTAIHSSYV